MLLYVFESSLSKKISIFTALRIYFSSLLISSPWCSAALFIQDGPAFKRANKLVAPIGLETRFTENNRFSHFFHPWLINESKKLSFE